MSKRYPAFLPNGMAFWQVGASVYADKYTVGLAWDVLASLVDNPCIGPADMDSLHERDTLRYYLGIPSIFD